MSLSQEEKVNRIVYTAGTWDVFHWGHFRLLQRVRAMSDILIVGVSTDALVQRYKDHLPVDSFAVRYQTICELASADVVLPQIQQFDVDRMRRLGVTEVVLGNDWVAKSTSELEHLKSQMCVTFLSRTENVSSSLIRNFLQRK